MFGFGGKKKQRNVDPRSERPRTAYVDRTAPAEFHGKPMTGKVGDVWKGIYSLREDLEAEVEALCGGGVYVAKVNDEETHEYLGTHHFEIMGDPKLNGKDIPVPVETDEEAKRKMDPVKESHQKAAAIRAQGDVVVAQAELDEMKAKVAPPEADPVVDAGVGDDLANAILMRLDSMDERFEKKEEEDKEDRHRREMKELKDDFDQKLENMRSSNQNNDGSGDKQLSAMRMVIEQGQQQASIMNTFLMTQLDKKEASATSVADAMVSGLERGIGIGEAKVAAKTGDGAEEDVSVMGLADNIVSEVAGMFNNYILTKGDSKPDPDAVANMIREGVSNAMTEARRLPQPVPPDAPVAPAAPEAPPAVTPMTKAMDQVLLIAIREFQNHIAPEHQTWMRRSRSILPAAVLMEFSQAGNDEDAHTALIKKYASPELFEELEAAVKEAHQHDQRVADAAAQRAPAGPVAPRATAPAPMAPAAPVAPRATAPTPAVAAIDESLDGADEPDTEDAGDAVDDGADPESSTPTVTLPGGNTN